MRLLMKLVRRFFGISPEWIEDMPLPLLMKRAGLSPTTPGWKERVIG